MQTLATEFEHAADWVSDHVVNRMDSFVLGKHHAVRHDPPAAGYNRLCVTFDGTADELRLIDDSQQRTFSQAICDEIGVALPAGEAVAIQSLIPKAANRRHSVVSMMHHKVTKILGPHFLLDFPADYCSAEHLRDISAQLAQGQLKAAAQRITQRSVIKAEVVAGSEAAAEWNETFAITVPDHLYIGSILAPSRHHRRHVRCAGMGVLPSEPMSSEKNTKTATVIAEKKGCRPLR